MTNHKKIKVIITVLSVLLAISIAALIFVMVKYHSVLQTASDTIDDNYIKPKTETVYPVDGEGATVYA